MKKVINSLKTERSKLFLFVFLSAMLQGAKPPIFTSSEAEEFNYHLTH